MRWWVVSWNLYSRFFVRKCIAVLPIRGMTALASALGPARASFRRGPTVLGVCHCHVNPLPIEIFLLRRPSKNYIKRTNGLQKLLGMKIFESVALRNVAMRILVRNHVFTQT